MGVIRRLRRKWGRRGAVKTQHREYSIVMSQEDHNRQESVVLEMRVVRGRKGGYTAYVNGSNEPEYSVSNLWEHTLQVCALHAEMFKENAFPPSSFFQTTQQALPAPVHHQPQPVAPQSHVFAAPPPSPQPRAQPPSIPSVPQYPREEALEIPDSIKPDGHVLSDLQKRLSEIGRENGRLASVLLVAGFTLSLIARGALGA
jgi:hypothetical protein